LNTEPTVYIIDDDPDARRALGALVGTMNVRMETYASAGEFLDRFDSSSHGCMLVDLRLSDINGLALLERLRERKVRLPVIMISAYADVPTAVRAMKTGAVDFLEKPCREQQLWEAVHEAILMDSQRRKQQGRRLTILRRMSRMSEGEREVLDSLVDGQTNREIAEQLGLSIRTIEVRRSKLMRKMRARSLAELIRMVLVSRDCEE